MIDLTSRAELREVIANLPPWPEPMPDAMTASMSTIVGWHCRYSYAARARLELARAWVAQTHMNECCAGKWSFETGRYEECDCGRDELLAALEAAQP